MIQEAGLVPAHRLGELLRQRRRDLGLGIEHMARNLPFEPDELRLIEAGSAPLTDADVNRLLSAYGTDASPVIPERFGLTIDLREASLEAGGRRVSLEPGSGDPLTVDDILGRYLSLLYLMRGLEPGVRLSLRDDDLSVLARALDEAVTDIERRLLALMVADGAEPWFSRLRHRLAVPAAGILVGLTAVGGLVLVQFPRGERPILRPTSAASVIDVDQSAALAPAMAVERSGVETFAYTPGDPASVGLAAEALIDYPFRRVLGGWTIDFSGPRDGFRGNTNTITRTISVYVGADDTPTSVAEVLAHEVGHAIDVTFLSEDDRRRWLDMRDLEGLWWPESGAADFAVGAGDFAEAVAAVLTGSPSDAGAGEFTLEELALVDSMLP